MKLLRRIVCLLLGHEFVHTGRHAIILYELRCERCGRLYVGNIQASPRVILPADPDSDRIFEDVEQIESRLRAQ